MKSSIEYIKEAWSIYTKKENLIFFSRIMAVLVIASSSVGYVLSYFFSTPGYTLENFDYSNIPMAIAFILLTILSVFIGLWSKTTSYIAIIKIGDSEKEIFKLGYKNIWRFFLVSLAFGLVILLGTILLIVPAVIFGIWYSFSIFLVLDKKMSIKESFIRSKEMVKGIFFKVLVRNAVFGLFGLLVSVLISAIPYIGPLVVSFIAPLFILPGFLLYRDLVRSN